MQPPSPCVYYAPMMHGAVQKFDHIIFKMNPTYRRSLELFAMESPSLDDIEDLRRSAAETITAIKTWGEEQEGEWAPKTVGRISSRMASLSPDGHFWPGRIERFSDVYIAGVWNTWRKTYILALSILVRCRKVLGSTESNKPEESTAQSLAEAVAASVPSHLLERLDEWMLEDENRIKTARPGRPSGGLFLLHPLFVVSRATIVSPDLREYFSDRLAWIGRHMGISQASVVADVCLFDPSLPQCFADLFSSPNSRCPVGRWPRATS